MEDFMIENEKPISIRSMDIVTFFNKVYGTMSIGLAVTFLISFLLYYIDFASYMTSFMFWAVIIAQFGLVIYLSSKLELYKTDLSNKKGLSTPMAFALFFLYSALTGITLSFIFYIFELNSILIILMGTTGMFAALSIAGRVTKRDLSGLGKFLITALFGLIITSIFNIFLRSSQLDFFVSVIGVLVFSGLIVYDNNVLKKMYENGLVNEGNLIVFGALTLYLDFINLFIRLLSIFGNRK